MQASRSLATSSSKTRYSHSLPNRLASEIRFTSSCTCRSAFSPMDIHQSPYVLLAALPTPLPLLSPPLSNWLAPNIHSCAQSDVNSIMNMIAYGNYFEINKRFSDCRVHSFSKSSTRSACSAAAWPTRDRHVARNPNQQDIVSKNMEKNKAIVDVLLRQFKPSSASTPVEMSGLRRRTGLPAAVVSRFGFHYLVSYLPASPDRLGRQTLTPLNENQHTLTLAMSSKRPDILNAVLATCSG